MPARLMTCSPVNSSLPVAIRLRPEQAAELIANPYSEKSSARTTSAGASRSSPTSRRAATGADARVGAGWDHDSASGRRRQDHCSRARPGTRSVLRPNLRAPPGAAGSAPADPTSLGPPATRHRAYSRPPPRPRGEETTATAPACSVALKRGSEIFGPRRGCGCPIPAAPCGVGGAEIVTGFVGIAVTPMLACSRTHSASAPSRACGYRASTGASLAFKGRDGGVRRMAACVRHRQSAAAPADSRSSLLMGSGRLPVLVGRQTSPEWREFRRISLGRSAFGRRNDYPCTR